MTTGDVQTNQTSEYPSGKRGSPVTRKWWQGTNDPYHRAEQEYSMASYSVNFVQGTQPNPYYPFVPPMYYWTPFAIDFQKLKDRVGVVDSNAAIKALSRLMSNIKGHDFNAALAFADVEKTADLLAKSSLRAIDAWKALRNKNFTEFVKLLPAIVRGDSRANALKREMTRGDIASIWLAAQYGWRPLINDVIDAFEAFDKVRQRTLPGKTYEGSAKSEPFMVYLGTNGSINPVPNCRCIQKVSYRAFVKETLTTAQSLGIVPAGLMSVVWERVPFSFVLDWFIPIGQTIEVYAFFSSIQVTFARTIFTRYSATHKNLYPQLSPPYSHTPASINFDGVTMKREVNLTGLGYLLPSFKSIGAALTNTHLLNAAALIFAAVEGKKVGSGRSYGSRRGSPLFKPLGRSGQTSPF